MNDPRLIDTSEKLAPVIRALNTNDLIAFDCETKGLYHRTALLRGVSLAVMDAEWYVINSALPGILSELATLSKRSDKHWIAWNAPFDLHFLKPHGFWPQNLIDAQVAAYLLNENDSMKLKEQAEMRLCLGEKQPSFKDLQRQVKAEKGLRRLDEVTIDDIPLERFVPYACKDGRFTYDMWPILYDLLSDEGLLDWFFQKEMPFIKALTNIESAGIVIDREKLEKLTADLQEKQEQRLTQWDKLTNGVNPNSSQQVAAYLYSELGYKPPGRTESGAPSTKALYLKRLLSRDKNGAIALLLEIKESHKLINTYLKNIRERIDGDRLYAQINRTRAVTGRLTVEKPSLQNIPVRTELGRRIREVFIAPAGYLLLVSDYSQIEMRIAAHYSGDVTLSNIFMEGGDPHGLTGELCSIPRDTAKTINYQKFYGGGWMGIADTVEKETGVRPKKTDVLKWLAAWDKAYPGVNDWMGRVIKYALRHGYVKTIGGRKRRLPEIRSYIRSIANRAARQAGNAPIQGSAADVIEIAMINLAEILPWYGAQMLLQVHDELVIEVPEKNIAETKAVVQHEMEAVGDYFNIRVPIVAEPGVGKNWIEAK